MYYVSWPHYKVVRFIWERLGKTVYKLKVNDVIIEAMEYIREQVVETGSYSIDNFGSFCLKKEPLVNNKFLKTNRKRIYLRFSSNTKKLIKATRLRKKRREEAE
jgi:nucleoid DNA-binding protein